MLTSCSNKKQLVYISDIESGDFEKVNYLLNINNIETGDILRINIQTVIPEASVPYNNISKSSSLSTMDLIKINGYLVDENKFINYPVLGEISVANQTEAELAEKITQLLIEGGHLTDPFVKVRIVNSKFTVLGEVRLPGTFSFFDKNLNLLQALGYAGDLLITAKRTNITLIREENGLRKSFKFSLTDSDILNQNFYKIKNNDIIIIEPNFSKVKSAGFIGSPTSIASISSLLLSITLLLINR